MAIRVWRSSSRLERAVGIATSCTAIGVGIVLSGTSAQAADEGLPSPAAQADYEQIVQEFLEENEIPENPPGAPLAVYEQYKQDIREFWGKVPWDAVYGQWGCTISEVTIGEEPEAEGKVAPTLSIASDCGTNGPDGIHHVPVATKTAVIGGGAAVEDCVLRSATFRQCVVSDRVGQIGAWARNEGNVDYGTAEMQLGQLALGAACGDGTRKARVSGPFGPHKILQTISTTNVNAKWSNRLWATPFGSYLHCAIM